MKILRILAAMVFTLSLICSAHAKIIFKDKFEDWRDEDSNPGFNGEFKLDKENMVGIIKVAPEKQFGKVMSDEEGITTKIGEKTKLYFKLLEDIDGGDITVNLMTAGEPYDSHEILSKLKKKGIYRVVLSEKVPWTGEHKFWVEIWIGGESGKTKAKFAPIKISDGKKAAKKLKSSKSKSKKKKKKKK
jgi:hypothetical protein